MSISTLARNIAESPTLAMNEKARLLREKGEKVIHLGAGEPKSKVPMDAILSSAAKLTSAEVRYTPTGGIASLVNAIIHYTDSEYGKSVSKENIIVSAGAKQAFYNLLMTIVNPQDEVVLLAPYWVSYPEIIKMVYGVPVVVTPENGRFYPTIEDVTKVIGSNTKAIVVNSPNNPSGCVYPAELIAELVEYCEKKDIYLVMDDIYHKLVFGEQQWVSAYQYEKRDIKSSKLVIVNGVSKSYAMTGFRIGWTIANKEVIETMTNVAAQNTSCPSVVTQAAAAGALTGVQSGIENLRLTLENNAKVMMTELGAFDNVKIIPPDGTFYCLPDFSAYSKNSVELSNFLLEKALVVTVPGAEFGLEGHLRLSFCGSIKDIIEGVARIKWALDPESPTEIYIGDRKLRRDWK